jgi:hypothetical protein
MAPRLVPASPWTRAAAGACLAAAALVGYQLWRSDPPIDAGRRPPEQTTERTAETENGDETSAGFELPPAEDYAEAAERPLFSRSRRPPPPAAEQPGDATAAGEQAAARIALNGVLLTDTRKVALLRFDNDSKVMHVAEGQEAGGWLIKKIAPDRVVVRRGQQESEILLDFKKSTNQQGAVPVPLSPTEPEAEVYDEGDQPD